MAHRAIWVDAEGNPCAPADAVYGEIFELDDDGVEIGRTYVDRRNSETVSSDDIEDLGVENQDLLKQGTWDIHHVVDGVWKPLDRLSELFVFLGVAGLDDLAVRRRRVAEFMELPAWKAAPERLVDEVGEWLVATRLN